MRCEECNIRLKIKERLCKNCKIIKEVKEKEQTKKMFDLWLEGRIKTKAQIEKE